jgi:acetyl-CoA carboxylase biotin carboxyl carrier protein
VQLDLDQLRELLASINQTDISELNLKGENFELVVRRGPDVNGQAAVNAGQAAQQPQQPMQQQPMMMAAPQAQQPAPLPMAAAPAPEPVAPPSNTQNWVEIKSPMVGTFYRAPAPGEPNFVNVGDKISSGQAVCILEAMKLMNELEAEVSGEVIEILVENGQPVEFDQPLMRVKPA